MKMERSCCQAIGILNLQIYSLENGGLVEVQGEMVVEVKEAAKELLKESLPDNFEIQFDFNSAKFDRKKYKDNLDESVNFLKINPNVGLVIEGNTDKKGDELYNFNFIT